MILATGFTAELQTKAVRQGLEKACPLIPVSAEEAWLEVEPRLPAWLQAFRRELAEEVDVEKSEEAAGHLPESMLKQIVKPGPSFSKRALEASEAKAEEWQRRVASDPALSGRGCSNARRDAQRRFYCDPDVAEEQEPKTWMCSKISWFRLVKGICREIAAETNTDVRITDEASLLLLVAANAAALVSVLKAYESQHTLRQRCAVNNVFPVNLGRSILAKLG